MTKIKYTDTAKRKLEDLQNNYREELERILLSKKLMPGDDFIEVTASDIDEVSKYFKFIRPINNSSKYLILIVYFIMGLIATFIGLFYDDFRHIMENRPTQAMILLVGLTMMLVSFVGYLFFRLKEKQRESFDKYRNEIEYIQTKIKNINEDKSSS